MSIRLKQQIAVQYSSGLHLRAAQMIAIAAQRYQSKISMGCDQKVADAKSLLDLLMLAAEHGTVLVVEAVGVDASEAMRDIMLLMSHPDNDDGSVTANAGVAVRQ
jgi:phosphocarrier protein HPr